MKTLRNTIAALLVGSFGLCSAFGQDQSGIRGAGPNPSEGKYSDAHRFVFFAVLEGCYTDGLVDEDIDSILPKTPTEHRDQNANFVLSCPLCGPALDAFKLYAERQRLVQIDSDKRVYTTFGPGLDRSVQADLAEPGQPCHEAIQGLINKWVDARIVKMRLTEEETSQLREKLTKMREAGERALKNFQELEKGNKLRETYKDWKACPNCAGASPMSGRK